MIHSEKEMLRFITKICNYLNSCASLKNQDHLNFDLISLMPKACVKVMSKFYINEWIELDLCIKNHLWIASSLMAFRIFEETIDTHLSCDLKVDPTNLNLKNKIQHCNRLFNQAFVQEMHNIRRLRNKSMHADIQLSAKDSLYVVLKVCKIVIYVYSFEKSDFNK